MTELLTAKQLQELLRVDRATIYRMADSGRLPAMKVGNQWRFPRAQIEAWLQAQSQMGVVAAASSAADEGSGAQPALKTVFPLECVQLIQDNFAELLGCMMLAVDMEGQPITQPSNACGLHQALAGAPHAHATCLAKWMQMAADPSLAPRFHVSPLGLLCARGLVRVGSEIRAMLIVGDIAPDAWPPSSAALLESARRLGVNPALLDAHLEEVHHLDRQAQERALGYVQKVADIFAHIAAERTVMTSRLQAIAAITQI